MVLSHYKPRIPMGLGQLKARTAHLSISGCLKEAAGAAGGTYCKKDLRSPVRDRCATQGDIQESGSLCSRRPVPFISTGVVACIVLFCFCI